MTGAGGGWAATRGRSLVVVAIIAGGALALVASTQVWAETSVAGVDLAATGADALALLQPIALAALALSLALSLTGKIARILLSALATLIGAAIIWISAPIAINPPVSAIQSVVTEHTGIAGAEGVAAIVSGITTTVWPLIAVCAGAVVAVAGVVGAITGATWRRGSSRYDARAAMGQQPHSGPLDAVDSWDDLSRGDDPTRTE